MTGDLKKLLEEHGSPLYVYRIEAVERAGKELRTQLPSGAALYFSLKANPHPVLGAALRAEGYRAEISSSGELASALQAGWQAADCLYTGPAKSRAEIANAVRNGVQRFSVESAPDFDRVAETAAAHGRTVECLLRISSTTRASASGLRMSGTSKFGIGEEEVLAAPARFVNRPGARIVGAHYFPISSAHNQDALIAEFEASILSARRLQDAGLPLDFLDLGGGFAAPYAQPGDRPRYLRLRQTLEAALSSCLPGWRNGHPTVSFESGRYLVADSGSLVCTVEEVKKNGGSRFVLLDSGIHQLGGMAGLGRLARPAATPMTDSTRATVTGNLVGPLCTPADVLGQNVSIPDVDSGDVLEIPNVGAYGLTASLLGFLSRPAPPEIVLRGERVISASRLTLSRSSLQVGSDEKVPVMTTGEGSS